MLVMNKPYYCAAIDTSTDMLCVAIARVTLRECDTFVEMLSVCDHKCRRRANVELIDSLNEALSQAKLSRDELDAYLVGRGPGSFTGVRIGISTAKGLARGANKPLYTASTLDACAWTSWAAGVRGLLGVAADAMRGEIYPALYHLTDDGAVRLYEREIVLKADEVVEIWKNRSDKNQLQITGDGLVRYGNLFDEAGLSNRVDKNLWWPSAEGLMYAAWLSEDLDLNKTADPAAVLPIYTRLSDAEENERKRTGTVPNKSETITGVADALAGQHMQFRPMCPADAEVVAALERDNFLNRNAWTANMFLSEFDAPNRIWWVAHDMGEILGFAGGMIVEDNVEILDVVVDRQHRREGIARKLLAHVSYDAQMFGCRTASLEVEQSNTSARLLYDTLGFHRVRLRKDYYAPGSDAVVMSAQLPFVLPQDNASPEPIAMARKWPLDVPVRTPEETQEIRNRELVIAIESSCDETAAAIIDKKGTILSSQVSTQIDFHARFGGVVPEIASRKHVEAIVGVVDAALEDAAKSLGLSSAISPTELAAIGVTQGPGLVGALVVGVAFAKGLAYAAHKPLIAVNHLEGHLYANLLTSPDLKPPFIFTLVSGGHTMLVHVRAWGDYEVLGETLDDAVGEAFDKVAKALGLGYPGGPIISRLAEQGNPKAIHFPRAMLHSHDYRFSLSGLKTAVVSYIEQETQAGRPLHLPDLAASFDAAVFDVQFRKALTALRETGAHEYCLGGGVAANPHLREMLIKKLTREKIRVTLPPQNACTDNAAMIAMVACRKYLEGDYASFSMDADPNMTL